jgi:hypothetical protein
MRPTLRQAHCASCLRAERQCNAGGRGRPLGLACARRADDGCSPARSFCRPSRTAVTGSETRDRPTAARGKLLMQRATWPRWRAERTPARWMLNTPGVQVYVQGMSLRNTRCAVVALVERRRACILMKSPTWSIAGDMRSTGLSNSVDSMSRAGLAGRDGRPWVPHYVQGHDR